MKLALHSPTSTGDHLQILVFGRLELMLQDVAFLPCSLQLIQKGLVIRLYTQCVSFDGVPNKHGITPDFHNLQMHLLPS